MAGQNEMRFSGGQHLKYLWIGSAEERGNDNFRIGNYTGSRMQDTFDINKYYALKLPRDFKQAVAFYPVAIAAATGNMYFNWGVTFAADGETYNTHAPATIASHAEAMTQNKITELASHPELLDGLTHEDYLGIGFQRAASDALDTVNADVILIGFVLEYYGSND